MKIKEISYALPFSGGSHKIQLQEENNKTIREQEKETNCKVYSKRNLKLYKIIVIKY